MHSQSDCSVSCNQQQDSTERIESRYVGGLPEGRTIPALSVVLTPFSHPDKSAVGAGQQLSNHVAVETD